MIFSNQRERVRFFRFAIVGAIGAVIDFGVFNLLTQTINYFGNNAVAASVISFILAVISNFTWNRLWTYPDSRSKPLAHQGLQFVIISVMGLAIRTPLFAWLEVVLNNLISPIVSIDFILTPLTIAHNLSLATVIVVVMLWNFFANRLWTYNDIE